METAGLIIGLLKTGLELWNQKESGKYLDRLIKLEKDFYKEYNKRDKDRSDAVLDNIRFELRILSVAFSAEAGKKNPQNLQR